MTTTHHLHHLFAFLFHRSRTWRAILAILATAAFPALMVALELTCSPGPLAYYAATFHAGGFPLAVGLIADASILIASLGALIFVGVQCWNLFEDWQDYLRMERWHEECAFRDYNSDYNSDY